MQQQDLAAIVEAQGLVISVICAAMISHGILTEPQLIKLVKANAAREKSGPCAVALLQHLQLSSPPEPEPSRLHAIAGYISSVIAKATRGTSRPPLDAVSLPLLEPVFVPPPVPVSVPPAETVAEDVGRSASLDEPHLLFRYDVGMGLGQGIAAKEVSNTASPAGRERPAKIAEAAMPASL